MNRLLRGTLAAALLGSAAVMVAESPTANASERPYVLTEGHIDLIEVTYDAASSGLRLQVKDDTGLYDDGPVFRDPAEVTIGVDAAAAALVVPEDLPESCGCGFIGEPGDTVYQLPMSQTDGLPWPGWSTERLVGSLPDGVDLPSSGQPVEVELEVSGPGDTHLYMWDAVGSVTNHYVDTTDAADDVIPMSVHQHAHAEWLFTEPGSYTITATPRATTTDGFELAGASADYHVQVGEGDVSELGLTVTPDRPDARYVYGQSITLTAAPTEPTDLDHYHWFIKPAGGTEFEISNLSTSSELKLPTSVQWDGAQVYASLYDDNHNVVASSDPLSLHVEVLDQVTTLTATSDQESYRVGDVARLTAVQDPETDEDHYHWYVRKQGEEFYSYIEGSDAAEASLPITSDLDGAAVVARLFNHDHAVIAESEPLSLDVTGVEALSTTTSVKLSRTAYEYGARRPPRVTTRVVTEAAEPAAGTVKVTAGDRVIATKLTLNRAGAATATLPRKLAPGRYRLKAAFTPADTTMRPSTSKPVIVKVTKASTITKARAVKRTIQAHQRGRLKITVGSTLTPAGKVVVRDGKRRLATARLSPRAKATVRLPRLKPGKHRLAVRYQGTDRFAASTGHATLRVRR